MVCRLAVQLWKVESAIELNTANTNTSDKFKKKKSCTTVKLSWCTVTHEGLVGTLKIQLNVHVSLRTLLKRITANKHGEGNQNRSPISNLISMFSTLLVLVVMYSLPLILEVLL